MSGPGSGFSEATVVTAASEARRLGGYVLVGEIAEGGMGRVYLARRAGAARFEKLSAVKVLHPHLAERQPDLVEMFLDEARIASMVAHPNVCSVLDYGEEKGIQFMVMEYLAGQPLREVLAALSDRPERRADPMFHPIVARVVAEACEGLHGAHMAVDEHGKALHVVHRDVSPGNVIITYAGAVKLMDFGVAKATGRRHETSAGTFKGKFAYAAPEAFDGVELDARSDIWSIGVVLWELLVGRGLFQRDSDAATMSAIVLKDPPSPKSNDDAVPDGLDAICVRALSRHREERYSTAREMARELNQYAVGSGVHIGTAEIAEWIGRLFPEERERALETDRAVRRLDPQIERAPILSGRSLDRALVSKVVVRGTDTADTDMAFQETQVAGSTRQDPTRKLTPSRPPPASSLEEAPTAPAAEPPPHRAFAAPPVVEPPPRRTGLLVVSFLALLLVAGGAAAALYYVTQDLGIRTPEVTELTPRIEEPAPRPPPAEPPSESLPPEIEIETEREEPEAASATAETDESPRPARTPERTGFLNVVVVGGWAEIHEGRRSLGRTPTRLELPVGRHRLRLSRPDGPSKTVTVRIRADEETELSVELPSESATNMASTPDPTPDPAEEPSSD